MRKTTKTLALLLALMFPVWLLAQTVITGRVVEAGTNNPLQGATVAERGTTNSTQTNAEGRFSIRVRNTNAKLVISFVGYVQEIVDARDKLGVTLAVDNTRMSEVVVTGLATSVK